MPLLRSAFLDGAHVDCGIFTGDPDGFATFVEKFLGAMVATHHMLGQVHIALHDAQTASGESYFQAWHGMDDATGKARDLFVAGRYVDEYACNKGEWRIARRKLITDWVRNDPADHGFYAANPATNRSARSGSDFSQTRDWPR